MTTSRRDFLKTSAALGGAIAVKPKWDFGAYDSVKLAPAPLNILVIGGTGLIGPHQVNHALARGHKVTLLNRARTKPEMFKGRVEQIIGDLNADVSGLKGKKFDVVLDNPTQLPYWVRNVAQYLKGNVGQYVFVSTMSVFNDTSKVAIDENGVREALKPGADPYTLERNVLSYGAAKTFAEDEAHRQYPNITTVVRPGLIVGPLDPTDRFTYWPVRIEQGGEVLAPGAPSDPMQFIDVRDLAEWMIRLAEGKVFGDFNMDGPQRDPLPIAEMLYGIKAAMRTDAKFTWVPAPFLAEQRVRGWSDMPVWMNPEGANIGFSQFRHDKAMANGLTYRPLAVTTADTLAWHKTRPAAEQARLAPDAPSRPARGAPPLPAGTAARQSGLSAAREAEVIAAWKAKQAAG